MILTGKFCRRVAARAGVCVCVVLVVPLALLDAFLWLAWPVSYHTVPRRQADGHIRGRYAPGQTYRTRPGHNPLRPIRTTQYENRINRHGFRGPDHALDPALETVRIAVFGDSAAFGFHDPEGETWPQRLGACLSAKFGVKTEVINLALPAMTLADSKISYLVNGRAFQPDIAIAYHTWTDLKRVGAISHDPEELLRAPAAEERLNSVSALRLLVRVSQIARRVRLAGHRARAHRREGRTIPPGWQPSPRARAWFRANVADFIRFTASDGVIPVVATQGTLAVSENLREIGTTRHVGVEMIGLSHRELADLWRWASDTICDVVAAEHALLVDVYRALPHHLEFLEDHAHLTPAGESRVAEIFCDALSAAPDITALYRARARHCS